MQANDYHFTGIVILKPNYTKLLNINQTHSKPYICEQITIIDRLKKSVIKKRNFENIDSDE